MLYFSSSPGSFAPAKTTVTGRMASLEDTILTDLCNHVGVGTSVSALLGHNHDGRPQPGYLCVSVGARKSGNWLCRSSITVIIHAAGAPPHLGPIIEWLLTTKRRTSRSHPQEWIYRGRSGGYHHTLISDAATTGPLLWRSPPEREELRL
jgi:hypothetical protein